MRAQRFGELAHPQREGLFWTSRLPTRANNRKSRRRRRACATRAGVKVVRPRLRLRALHLDPAALLARARLYEDDATINATKHS